VQRAGLLLVVLLGEVLVVVGHLLLVVIIYDSEALAENVISNELIENNQAENSVFLGNIFVLIIKNKLTAMLKNKTNPEDSDLGPAFIKAVTAELSSAEAATDADIVQLGRYIAKMLKGHGSKRAKGAPTIIATDFGKQPRQTKLPEFADQLKALQKVLGKAGVAQDVCVMKVEALRDGTVYELPFSLGPGGTWTGNVDGATLRLYERGRDGYRGKNRPNRIREVAGNASKTYRLNKDLSDPIKALFGEDIWASEFFHQFLERFLREGPDLTVDTPGFVYVYARAEDLTRKHRDHVLLHKVGYTRQESAGKRIE